MLIVLGSVLVGGIVGEAIGIERGLERVGATLKQRFGRRQARFTEGFVVASLVFCVGPLTILGSIQDADALRLRRGRRVLAGDDRVESIG